MLEVEPGSTVSQLDRRLVDASGHESSRQPRMAAQPSLCGHFAASRHPRTGGRTDVGFDLQPDVEAIIHVLCKFGRAPRLHRSSRRLDVLQRRLDRHLRSGSVQGSVGMDLRMRVYADTIRERVEAHPLDELEQLIRLGDELERRMTELEGRMAHLETAALNAALKRLGAHGPAA